MTTAQRRVVVAAGARPNFMKVAPIMTELEARDVPAALVHTGQHYDPLMSDVFFEELGIRKPDHFLGAGSGSHAAQTAAVMVAFEPLLHELSPEHVIVVGDVNSTAACALVGAKSGAIVSHVEAGLRSRDWAMPEEVNRVVADRVSDLLFASSEDAVLNLRDEGYRADQIHLAGNTMIDTLLRNVERARERPILDGLGLERGRYGAVTLHRPANVDDDTALARILDGLARVAKLVPLVLPAHPRAAARLRAANPPAGLRIIDPLGYLDFLAVQANSAVVLTDSGGIQEETTVLGIPCLTLRENTERPITVTEGTNRVVGRDPAAMAAGAEDALAGRIPKRRPALWDGRAAGRIADVLLGVEAASLARPTERPATPTLGGRPLSGGGDRGS